MENKKAVLVAAVVALIIAGLIIGAIWFLTSILKGRATVRTNTTVSPTPTPVQSQPATVNGGNTPPTGQSSSSLPMGKTVSIDSFTFHYPQNWGVLKCANSRNIEFDPYNGTDQSGVVCDYAVKPVTVLVTNVLNCQGESITLGGSQVIRSKIPTQTGVDYRWCVTGQGGVNLDITHRVSSDGSRATSKEDFSSQIEQMISNFRAPSGGS